MMLFGGEGAVLGALGRDSTLTGRTEIWAAVLPMCPNGLVGAGFESFWNTYGGDIRSLGTFASGINEAHNGYIEVYLNLGWMGIGFLALILVTGYLRAAAAFRGNPQIGSLMLAFLATTAMYGITEAGFRILTPTWTFLMIAHITSTRYALDRPRSLGSRGGLTKQRSAATLMPSGTSVPNPAIRKIPSFHRL